MLYGNIGRAADTVVPFGSRVFSKKFVCFLKFVFKKWGETLDYVSYFSLYFFRALARFLRALQQSTVKASLFVK